MSMPSSRPGPRALGAALSATLTLGLAVAGCGGKGAEVDTATVIGDPTAARPSSPAAAPSAPPVAPASASTSNTPAPAASGGTAAAAPVKAEGWGTLKGRVVFEGDAPALKVIKEKGKADKDPNVCAATADIKSERLIVDGGSKGVKNVIVYIPKPTAVNPEAKSNKSSAAVVFDQKNCVFEPHVLAAMTGVKIEIKSSDAASHNIHSLLRNNGFNDAIAPNGASSKTPAAAERQPGLVTCDIHPWMAAYWLILDNPYFAVTDDKGNFEIKNAPAGTQKVAVWQEATGFLGGASGQDVTIAPNGETAQEYKIQTAQIKPEQ